MFPPVNICRLDDDKCKQFPKNYIIPGSIVVDTRPISTRCNNSHLDLKTNQNNVYIPGSNKDSKSVDYNYSQHADTESQIYRLGCYLNSCDNRPIFDDGLASHPQEGLKDWIQTKNMVSSKSTDLRFNESTKRKIIMGEKLKQSNKC